MPTGATTYPSREQIQRARARIEGHVRRTPVVEVQHDGHPFTLKLELLQHTGSFKPRGAFNSVLSASERPDVLVAASGGNHGLAVAHVGRALGIPAEIFVPRTAPEIKVARLRSLGARVHQVGEGYAEALQASREVAQQPGALSVHAYDSLPTVTGQGTVGAELAEQVPSDTVLVAVGGGGLIGGVTSWYTGSVRVVAVEPHGCPTLHAALAAGWPVPTSPSGLAADSLGASVIGDIGLAAAQDTGVQSLLVGDDDIRAARQWLWRETRVAAEAGGATALAAVLSGAYRPEPGERVSVIVCGGNADPGDLSAEPDR
ncbi:MAG: threonine/serine dehydratase [Ornithinimicrobium sp.]|uniref:threonine/serine dehydratase n=1 Tax=Ornithinimicrobium sp. TaxID=1977084 RepID=UPI003D9B5A04